METTEEQTQEILKLSKLNYSVVEIAEKMNSTHKEISAILTLHDSPTVLSLKKSMTKYIKELEELKTIAQRESLAEQVNATIQAFYDNFKWVVELIFNNCSRYYNVDNFGESIDNLKDVNPTLLKQYVKKNKEAVVISDELNFPLNTLMQLLLHINKNNKSALSKKLSKLVSETKKDQRKLIQLEIEKIIDEMSYIYKWCSNEYKECEKNLANNVTAVEALKIKEEIS